jgi:arginine exporter protein ArgO
MKIAGIFLALVALIGGLDMLFTERDGWIFGIPLIAGSLTYFWWRSGFHGLK